MTRDEMDGVLSEVSVGGTFAPLMFRWEIEEHEDGDVALLATMQIVSTETGLLGELRTRLYLGAPGDVRPGPLLKEIRKQAARVLLHELDECLKWKGRPVVEPHPQPAIPVVVERKRNPDFIDDPEEET